MNHPMRRKDRALSEAEALEILARTDHGVLATVDETGWPYAVPLNHVLMGDSLYIHCALEGHKLQNIAHDSRVSYCVIDRAEVLPDKLTTLYESAIVFGSATQIDDESEKRSILRTLCQRFAPGRDAEADASIQRHVSHTAILRIRIERMTGKAHR
jgi:nitroimidazol reductase NimA-like FMN-containing flavoprotein (pyridoxamine 5'-phosphate oxidase superfamily)